MLVTRSEDDPNEVLRQIRLFELFDRVLHVTDRAVMKSSVISRDLKETCGGDDKDEVTRSAIFIDDSFKERKDVLESVGIPVFDMGMLDVLIDPLIL